MKPSTTAEQRSETELLQAMTDGQKRRVKAQKDMSASYDEFKQFEGQRYTGMKIGRSHKWYYDKGEWKEKKVTPDLWQINYAVKKRRAGKAPEGSGVPVGTEYHWYIIAHQNVQEAQRQRLQHLDDRDEVQGRPQAGRLREVERATRAQRRRMIKFLQETIQDLEQEAEVTPQTPGNEKNVPQIGQAGRLAAGVDFTVPRTTRDRH